MQKWFTEKCGTNTPPAILPENLTITKMKNNNFIVLDEKDTYIEKENAIKIKTKNFIMRLYLYDKETNQYNITIEHTKKGWCMSKKVEAKEILNKLIELIQRSIDD